MSSRLKLLQSLSGRLCSGRNWLLACVLSWAVVSLLGTCSFINYPWDLGFGTLALDWRYTRLSSTMWSPSSTVPLVLTYSYFRLTLVGVLTLIYQRYLAFGSGKWAPMALHKIVLVGIATCFLSSGWLLHFQNIAGFNGSWWTSSSCTCVFFWGPEGEEKCAKG